MPSLSNNLNETSSFEEQFSKDLLQSEKFRARVLVFISGALLFYVLIIYIFFGDYFFGSIGTQPPFLWALLILSILAVRSFYISKKINVIYEKHPDFCFMAEVYWDLEWTLQQQGFDYTYDKRLYDRLVEGTAPPVRGHLLAGLDFQDHLARFLENHDEPRAAATFVPEVHRAAAVITFLTPGLRFFHQGQREGKRVRIPMHLGRGPVEKLDASLSSYYENLIVCLKDLAFRDGRWQLLEARTAWHGNRSSEAFVIFSWSGPGNLRRLVAVNYAGHQGQCYVKLPWSDLDGQTWQLCDKLGSAVYYRNGDDLTRDGLYLDLPAWGYHAFEVTAVQDKGDIPVMFR